ncbi:gamma-tubulin complex component 6 [Plakobranchus ocellatus]|uniref:Gamma-tubulin complex component 6 n=1 Tax=Plakobranchus ocellatus TaxID=259542 RepID=A0AAV4CZ78_9GAST|nr:gamma-tubulin complex component 6 [Plakobranchus ocellatus]
MQHHSKNKRIICHVADITTLGQDSALNTTSSHHDQVTAASISGRDNVFDIALNTSSSHHGQVTAASISGRDNVFDIALNTTSSHHGQVTAAAISGRDNDFDITLNTSSSHHGQVTAAAISGRDNDFGRALNTTSSHHDQVTATSISGRDNDFDIALNTSNSHHDQVTATSISGRGNDIDIALNTISSHHGQVTATSISGRDNDFDITLNTTSSHHDQVTAALILGRDNDFDIALTFTCRDRCGMKISFPCSCSATCVVYGTCCDNLAKDCPHVWEEGTIKFDHLHSAGFICDDDFVYKVSTCPSPVQGNVQQEQGKWSSLRTENIQTTENWFPLDADAIPETKGVMTSNLTSPTARMQNFSYSRRSNQTMRHAMSPTSGHKELPEATRQ